MQTPRSSISEFVWPGIPAGAGATLMGLQFQLEQSQWWPPETVATLQSRQMQCLLQHAYQTVPYYKEVLDAASIDTSQPLSPEQWAQIPTIRATVFVFGMWRRANATAELTCPSNRPLLSTVLQMIRAALVYGDPPVVTSFL